MEKIFKRAEIAFTVVALIHYSTGWLKLIISGGASEGDGVDLLAFNYKPDELIFLLTYFVSFCLLLLRWKKLIYVLRKDQIIAVLVIIAIASTMWSVYPSDTLRRSCTGFAGTTLFGFYIGTRYTLRDQVKLLGWSYGLILIFSIIYSVALPRYGIEHGVHAGAWRGIFVQKNLFGRGMIFSGFIFILMKSVMPPKKQWILSIGLGLSVILLLLSRSTSSLINFVVLLFALTLYRILRLRYILLFPAFFTVVTMGSIVFHLYTTYAEQLLGLIGKDPSLTGRTEIWEFVWEMIEKRPLLGYGFTAFWNGLDGPSAYVIRAARWDVPYAHNGLLDLWLELGLLGVSVYFVGFSLCLLRSIRWARISVGLDGLWPLMGLTYIVMCNLTEGPLLGAKNIFWVLYTMLVISLQIPQKELKLAPINLPEELESSSDEVFDRKVYQSNR